MVLTVIQAQIVSSQTLTLFCSLKGLSPLYEASVSFVLLVLIRNSVLMTVED